MIFLFINKVLRSNQKNYQMPRFIGWGQNVKLKKSPYVFNDMRYVDKKCTIVGTSSNQRNGQMPLFIDRDKAKILFRSAIKNCQNFSTVKNITRPAEKKTQKTTKKQNKNKERVINRSTFEVPCRQLESPSANAWLVRKNGNSSFTVGYILIILACRLILTRSSQWTWKCHFYCPRVSWSKAKRAGQAP